MEFNMHPKFNTSLAAISQPLFQSPIQSQIVSLPKFEKIASVFPSTQRH